MRSRRLVAICHVDGTELQAVLIREGLAWAFVRYAQGHVARESAARAAKRQRWHPGDGQCLGRRWAIQ